jgi:hypothetical protein
MERGWPKHVGVHCIYKLISIYIYSPTNAQCYHINCVTLSYMFRTLNLGLSLGWTQITGSKHVGQCYTINVTKLYICRTVNIEIKCTECIMLSLILTYSYCCAQVGTTVLCVLITHGACVTQSAHFHIWTHRHTVQLPRYTTVRPHYASSWLTWILTILQQPHPLWLWSACGINKDRYMAPEGTWTLPTRVAGCVGVHQTGGVQKADAKPQGKHKAFFKLHGLLCATFLLSWHKSRHSSALLRESQVHSRSKSYLHPPPCHMDVATFCRTLNDTHKSVIKILIISKPY